MRLSFEKKIRLLELVVERHPDYWDMTERLYPGLDGEVPFNWVLPEEEVEALIKEVRSERQTRL